jgi:hypothetical protein
MVSAVQASMSHAGSFPDVFWSGEAALASHRRMCRPTSFFGFTAYASLSVLGDSIRVIHDFHVGVAARGPASVEEPIGVLVRHAEGMTSFSADGLPSRWVHALSVVD